MIRSVRAGGLLTLAGAGGGEPGDIDIDIDDNGVDIDVVGWTGNEPAHPEPSSTPRLFLVPPESAPPLLDEPLDDWVRLPAEPAELESRLGALRRRWRRISRAEVVVSEGVLRRKDRWVLLTPLEARLAAELVEHLGVVVSRWALVRAGWPTERTIGRSALDTQMMRLRRRVPALGLTIRTVRGRGYLMAVERRAPEQPRTAPDESGERP